MVLSNHCKGFTKYFSTSFQYFIFAFGRKHNICINKLMKFYLVVPVLFLLFLASCSNIKNPEFRKVEQFRVKNVGLQEVTVGFNVSFFNPNKFGVTVKDAVADIYMDSVFLGKFSQDSLIYVNRKADFSIPLSERFL